MERLAQTQPDSDSIEALHKAWQRNDLQRYLRRWQNSEIPKIPGALWRYSWVACDLGCGFGKYVLEESRKHPDRGYLAMDKGTLRGGKLMERVASAGRPNLFGIHGNAIPIMAQVEEGTLDQISIFYPNPWWPSKHRKKRWSYHPLLPKLAASLKPGGIILLTSNEPFYLVEWIYALGHHPQIRDLQLQFAGPVTRSEGRSHFETKFLNGGIPCGEVRFIKKATPGSDPDRGNSSQVTGLNKKP